MFVAFGCSSVATVGGGGGGGGRDEGAQGGCHWVGGLQRVGEGWGNRGWRSTVGVLFNL